MSGLVWACPDCHSDLDTDPFSGDGYCPNCLRWHPWSMLDDGSPDFDEDHREAITDA